ncbi:HNH endonuclease signature motif containing protein [Kosakonia sp. R1.Fl]|uniref:HNH endonuclease n=1 Tax=Kosakonia sp. R1.Fl TaxID=2928706 RepID=UPI00201DBBB5|nr:HNH endonuclease signature motif containing protein [Kosakonia sp. R1.Fl]MCL6744185.1 HNH endonuclease [Kosakonia sp. R1.Fl]
MLKLKQPAYTYADMLTRCREGITGNPGLLLKVNEAIADLQTLAASYRASVSTGELYTIQPLQKKDEEDPIVVGRLTKSDFVKLYSNYVVGKKKPARDIYDALMTAANEKCPFCGGIGRPRNLDHYLPKAHYPQFSILPINLVPACRDCNMDGKGEAFAKNEAEQIIHPYLDDSRYYDEQWISARYLVGTNDEPGVIEYFVSPPADWDDAHKQRVEKHFNDFYLSLRYSKEAGARLVVLLALYSSVLQLSGDKNAAKDLIFQTIINKSPFVNHWERVMCLALMSDL